MFDEISDYKLLKVLKNRIGKNRDDIHLMRSTYCCGSKVVHGAAGYVPAVFVVTNNQTAKFWGVTTCKNAWMCPVCSGRKMSQYASEIAAAIDALKSQGQTACMITLTIPHTRTMSCSEVTDILFATWKDFVVRGNKNLKANDGYKHDDPFASFCEEFNCKHRVRVGEFTYGEHGWHPHFHCLFWVDTAKLQKVAEWQERLNKRWLQLAKRKTIAEWNKRNPQKKADNRQRAEIMYEKMDTEASKGFFVSVDDRGKVIAQESSMYVCGWGADKELTGNFRNKATAEGHMTPYQMLEKYRDTGDESLLDLYMEFARAVRQKQRRRINFSVHSGLKKIIAQWKLTNAYMEVIKKKRTSLVSAVGKWRMVCWFTENQWWSICFLDKTEDIIAKILEVARQADGKRRITEMLQSYGVDISGNGEHPHAELVSEMLNEVA